jgi:hypothetical protein
VIATDDRLAIIADIEARAGASDEDRPAWLAERQSGITATEIRDLYLRKITVQRLIEQKLSKPGPPLRAHAVLWGRLREPQIALHVHRTHGLKPESRVFRAVDNPRFLASPDAWGFDLVDGLLEVAECKTSKHNIGLGSVDYVRNGYEIQQQWVMRVLGAARSIYAWEQHDDDWQDRGGEFPEPMPLNLFPTLEVVERDDALIAELEVIATGFLAALDAAKAGEPAPFDDEVDTHAVNYLRGLDEEKAGAVLKKTHWEWLLDRLTTDEAYSQESPLARVSFSPAVEETRPLFSTDVEAAKSAAPNLYLQEQLALEELESAQQHAREASGAVREHEKQFTTQTGSELVQTKKPALRVTEPKQQKGDR